MSAPKLKLKNTTWYKYLFKRDTLLATILVFVVIGLFAKLESKLGILDPKEITAKNFDYNDLAFNLLNKHSNIPADTDIYIVNIGNSDRQGIAKIISKVTLAKPKVIGVDVLFNDSLNKSDTLLKSIFHKNKLIVAAYQLDAAKNRSGNYFADSTSKTGYVNFTLDNQSVIRQFTPYIAAADTDLSFSTAIVKAACLKKYHDLTARNKPIEPINYTRTENKFIIIDGSSAQSDFSIVKNKIVLIGAIDSGANYEDKHFTPLNATFTGNGLPDMSGVVIHANIIRMVLDGNYVKHWPPWLNWLLSFVLCWVHMAFFISYFIEKHVWFHLAAKLAQLVTSVFFIYLSLFLFYSFNEQINMTQTIIAIVLAVDVLYFYEAGVIWLHHKKGFKTLFHHGYPN